MKKFNLHLYLVTDEASKCRLSLLETVRKAADGGVTIVQYRSTNPDAGTCYREALPIRDFLASRGIPFIVNNRIDLALALEADGVHIGQRDLPVPSVRAMIGPDKILGLSVSNKEQLRAVDASLVDYLGMGPVFPTISKLNAPPVLGVEASPLWLPNLPCPLSPSAAWTRNGPVKCAPREPPPELPLSPPFAERRIRKPPHGLLPDGRTAGNTGQSSTC